MEGMWWVGVDDDEDSAAGNGTDRAAARAAPSVPEERAKAVDEFRPSIYQLKTNNRHNKQLAKAYGWVQISPNRSDRDRCCEERCSCTTRGSACQLRSIPENHKLLTPAKRIHSIVSSSLSGLGVVVISPVKPSGPVPISYKLHSTSLKKLTTRIEVAGSYNLADGICLADPCLELGLQTDWGEGAHQDFWQSGMTTLTSQPRRSCSSLQKP